MQATMSSDQDRSHLARVCVACSACDVAEIYTPAHGNWLGSKTSFRPGLSLDLTTRNHSEKFWDLCHDDVQELTRMQEAKPLLVMESPPCITFSQPSSSCMPPTRQTKGNGPSEAEPHVGASANAYWKHLNEEPYFFH